MSYEEERRNQVREDKEITNKKKWKYEVEEV